MSELYHIISDGSCDLSPEFAKENNVTIVPFYVSFDDMNYKKENVEVGIRDFYQQMIDNPKTYPKTSMPSLQDYADVFLPFAESNTPVICICINSKFSGSIQSATNAKEMILEDYPNAQITVIDATINTVLQGLYVVEAIRLRDQGVSYEESIKRLEEIRSTGRIFFTVGDLEYLKHGGRIGRIAGIAGSILGIKPIIILKEGELFPGGVGRSRKGTLNKCTECLIQYIQENGNDINRFSINIGYGYDYDEAVEFRARTLETLKEKGFEIDDIPIYQIGATIAVHTGPYPLGFGIIEKAN